jgi:hypothetical protein
MYSHSNKNPGSGTVKTFPLPSLLSSVQWVFSNTSSNQTITPSVNANVYFPQNLTVHGTINPVSDANMKEKITPLSEEQFSPLLHLYPKQYTLKKDVGTPQEGQLHFGFLAQEVSPLYPHLVGHVYTDKNIKTLTLNTLEMIPLLVGQMQQLHKDVELLKQHANT